MKKKFICICLTGIMVFSSLSQTFAKSAYSAGIKQGVDSSGNLYKTINTGDVAKDIGLMLAGEYYSTTYDSHTQGKSVKNGINSTFVWLGGHSNGNSLFFKHVGQKVTLVDGSVCSSAHEAGVNRDAGGETTFVNFSDPELDLSNVKVMVLSGCDSYPMANVVAGERQDRCAIGFNGQIDNYAANEWSKNFVKQLAVFEKSVYDAKVFANTEYTYTDRRVTNQLTYGNQGIRLSFDTRSNEPEEKEDYIINYNDGSPIKEEILDEDMQRLKHEDELLENLRNKRYKVYDDVYYDFDTQDTSAIEQYIIENIDEDFNLDRYKVDKMNNEFMNEAFIIYDYYIDGKKTNIMYMAVVSNGKVTDIMRSKEAPVYEDEIAPKVRLAISEDEIKQKALENSTWLKEGFEVKNQSVLIKTNPSTNKPYAVVITDFEGLALLTTETYIYEFEEDEAVPENEKEKNEGADSENPFSENSEGNKQDNKDTSNETEDSNNKDTEDNSDKIKDNNNEQDNNNNEDTSNETEDSNNKDTEDNSDEIKDNNNEDTSNETDNTNTNKNIDENNL